jgi:hypothetical protein
MTRGHYKKRSILLFIDGILILKLACWFNKYLRLVDQVGILGVYKNSKFNRISDRKHPFCPWGVLGKLLGRVAPVSDAGSAEL